MMMRIAPLLPREARRDDARFLPAAIALRDGEPAMPGRWLLRAVFLLLAALLAWALIGRVDVVAVAAGRVIPDGRSKVLQSLDGGIVRAIHVREGEQVQEGQVLLELDGAELLAERARVRGELQAERLALGAALALWRLLESGDADGSGPVLAAALREAASAPDAEQFALQAWLLESRLREQARRRDALLQRLDARMAAQRAIAANLVRLEHGVPILAERAASARWRNSMRSSALPSRSASCTRRSRAVRRTVRSTCRAHFLRAMPKSHERSDPSPRHAANPA